MGLTQAQIGELFQTTPQNVTMHLKTIFAEGELEEEASCKDRLHVRDEGPRKVRRRLNHYNLDAILAVGYRVRSPRGTQFRQWATARLREYLVKGFVLDDARLKQPGGWDYFDELLARRSSTPSCASTSGTCCRTRARWLPTWPKSWRGIASTSSTPSGACGNSRQRTQRI